MSWVVMIVGPKPPSTVMGPYQNRWEAEEDADRWNTESPDADDDWCAVVYPIRPFAL